jgi:hypothetical protein
MAGSPTPTGRETPHTTIALLGSDQLRAMVSQAAKDGVSELCTSFGTVRLLAQYGFKQQPRGFSCRLASQQLRSFPQHCVLVEFEFELDLIPATVD